MEIKSIATDIYIQVYIENWKLFIRACTHKFETIKAKLVGLQAYKLPLLVDQADYHGCKDVLVTLGSSKNSKSCDQALRYFSLVN